MNWRVFQVGFFFGCAVALYSQYDGATGIRTLADVAAGGFLIGFLIEALWAVTRWHHQLSRADR